MARSPSPKPTAKSAGTLGRTAVRGKGPSARTSATANSRDARISRGTAARGVSTSSGCGALPPAPSGGTFFFTVRLLDQRSNLLVTISTRCARRFAECAPAQFSHRRLGRPPRPQALNDGELGDVAGRRCQLSGSVAIKTGFTKSLPIGKPRSPVMTSRGERGIWQRRYWEHTIRGDRNFAANIDYTHFNPVKHGLVAHPADWPLDRALFRAPQRSSRTEA